jgi:hypothetical protein
VARGPPSRIVRAMASIEDQIRTYIAQAVGLTRTGGSYHSAIAAPQATA